MRPILPCLAALLLAAVAVNAGGQTIYRCEGPGGTPTFSDHRCGPDAVEVRHLPPMNTSAPSAGEQGSTPSPSGGTPQVQLNVNNSNTVNVEPQGEGANAGANQPQPRSNGLPFDVYRRLETGMSEGQVLAIAGPPDHETIDSQNTADGVIRKSYYYFSSGYNAFVTRIQFVNGEVRSIERTPRLTQ